jgi:mannose-1-phosphate guanylyltransferase
LRSREIRSVLLAAGRGTRLKPLTDVLPKPVVPLLDLPLAAWVLNELAASCPPVIVNAAHLSATLIERLTATASPDRVEFTVEEPEPYGTAGTLGALRDRLGDPFIVHNADALTDIQTAALLESHSRSGAAGTIAVRLVDSGADFEVDPADRPRLLDRRLQPDRSGALYLGAAVFDRAVLDLIPPERPADLARAVLGPLADEERLALHVHDGYWRDVGRLHDYLAASLDLLDGIGPPAPRPWPGTIVEVAGGRAYLGPDADATAGELGAGAVLLSGCSLGRSATVRSSIVWPGEHVPAGTTLDRAVWALGRAFTK